MENIEFYTGNEAYAFLSFCKKDTERISEVIKCAMESGVRIWADENCAVLNAESSERMRSSAVCVFFISRAATCSHGWRSALTHAIETKKRIVMVFIEKAELTICQKLQAARAKVITAYNCGNAGELSRSVFSEPDFEGCTDKSRKAEKILYYSLIRQSTGEEIVIRGNEYSLGRSETMTDYTISGNAAISRLHAVIKVEGQQCAIIDQNSSNRTMLGNKELTPLVEYIIKDGDIITLADEQFLFRAVKS